MKKSILIADDDQDLSELIGMVFYQLGYLPVCVTNCEDALLKINSVDLVIIDSFDKKEFEIAKFCQKKNIPCIYHTGRLDITDEEYYMFDSVIEKPGMNCLIKIVNKLISKIAV
jgi:DNA-binding NtrC family response regulator